MVFNIEGLKNKIKQWLFKDELIRLSRIEHDNNLLLKSLNIGVDFHFMKHSWAVVCLDGNPCYIRFMALPAGEVRAIKDFLKQFTRSANKIVDLPPNLREFMYERD